MTKAQLCQHMVSHFQARARAEGARPLRRDEAREFLDELQRLCGSELANGGPFSIPKVAKLVIERRPQRRGRDPRTGKEILIPARRVVRARVSRLVRGAVEGPL